MSGGRFVPSNNISRHCPARHLTRKWFLSR